MSRTAIIAGQGALPAALARAIDDPQVYALEGFEPDGLDATPFRLERLVPFLDHLHEQQIERVVFAGAIQRPKLDPESFDQRTALLVPRILMAMQSGDDAALRTVLDIFEENDLSISSASEIHPELTPSEGVLTGTISDFDRRDVERAARIVATLGPLDIGQGAVVAQGLCLAIEALPGTRAMLEFAKLHSGLRPRPDGARGVLFKAPKPDQDLRIDMPTIGPDTIAQAADAGLAGVAWQAGTVIVLDRDECVRRADAAGMFLWSAPRFATV
ncbi:UDP-2,3-diacylglucosamine diphosphatase LpxI [Paracoccus sp. 1_MG-2023]|uniref:LpxI family protein n=1 Tax=unclassified Paracoccus (in: a-proteobacteria) TaxID=2688777 RepID=UPI001C0A4731|nr:MULTISPECIES: UDP-2,3-diacylglucosamine diphosphatase LpxI [unclassified Paracoccus (in: a-proteobacteria)]MBU2958830.1 UDP-2,3-diacylglucosamine diphosphatase LpxI [Paracoccus sp. C2R09]MDO6670039.1 UDP-2,3-diacylglucosamine diphosphatase LpxI [Paracoccus sp. 1_MG-2023]